MKVRNTKRTLCVIPKRVRMVGTSRFRQFRIR